MLNNIHIQNFRCFEDFKAEGFERINLIGGKNNSGKTCLLEALGTFSNHYSFIELVSLRGLQSSIYKNINHLDEGFEINASLGSESKVINVIGDSIGIDNPRNGYLDLYLLFPNKELPKIDILTSFDNFKDKTIKQVVKVLKCVDDRIDNIRTYATKQGLWLKKKDDDDDQPLEFYGDATKKVIKYFTPFFEKSLKIVANKFGSYLLIDEIENGIHHTAHEEFWKNIFKISKELNVQVFATTHSLEMITAFNLVAKQYGEGAYFEMSREYGTNKIFAFKHDTELLTYELEKTESTLRGE